VREDTQSRGNALAGAQPSHACSVVNPGVRLPVGKRVAAYGRTARCRRLSVLVPTTDPLCPKRVERLRRLIALGMH
jgi:hypothetical protein